jgi:putative inorganic carbon (HCO3(-)) transporter
MRHAARWANAAAGAQDHRAHLADIELRASFWPEAALLVVVFLLYTNIPVLVHQTYGVPTLVAGSYILLLAVPLIHLALFRGEKFRVDPTFLLMMLFLAVLVASSLQARNVPVATQRLVTYAIEGLLLYWLVFNVIRRLATLRRVFWTLLAVGALLGALNVYHAATASNYQFGGLASRDQVLIEKAKRLGNIPSRPLAVYRGADRAGGPVLDPNRYAQIMIVLLPLALLQFRAAKTRARRIGAAAVGALILAAILLSYSRGAFLALALLTVLLPVVGWVRPARLLAGVVILAAAVAVVAPGYFQRVGTIGDAASLLSRNSGAGADGAIRGRTTEMLAALHAALDHPVLGVGPGQYAKVYSAEYHQLPGIGFRDIRGTRRAHSLYLEIAADTGIVGMFVFLAILVASMTALWRTRRRYSSRRPDLSAVATALWLSVTMYLVTGVFLHMSHERYFWFLLALASAAVQVIRSHAASDAAASPVLTNRAAERARALMLAGESGQRPRPQPGWTWHR